MAYQKIRLGVLYPYPILGHETVVRRILFALLEDLTQSLREQNRSNLEEGFYLSSIKTLRKLDSSQNPKEDIQELLKALEPFVPQLYVLEENPEFGLGIWLSEKKIEEAIQKGLIADLGNLGIIPIFARVNGSIYRLQNTKINCKTS
jgi:hypothetical protein